MGDRMKKEQRASLWSPLAEELSLWVRIKTAFAGRKEVPVRRSNFVSPSSVVEPVVEVFE